MTKRRKGTVIVLIIIAAAAALFTVVSLWLNGVWFNELGYLQVYTEILGTRIGLWLLFFVLFFAFSGLNIRSAFKKGNISGLQIQRAGEQVELNKRASSIAALVILLVLSLIMANNGSKNWDTVLKYFNSTRFEMNDPLFQKDISFYVFILPLYLFLKSWILSTVLLTVIAVGILYMTAGQLKWENKRIIASDQAKKHILFLLFLAALVIAWNYWLARYQLLFSTGGLIFGADFTDATVVRPVYSIMIAASLITALFFFIGMRRRSLKQMFIGLGILLGSIILFVGIIPGLVQQFSVKPNELQKQSPYIEANIQFTREGYNLNNIIKQVYPVEASLTAEDFKDETKITGQIRLWDQRPLQATFSQVQEFRLYYNFSDVDVDRYYFGDDYRQVMLSAREINTNNLPQSARTWINEKLQYTHGYGIVMAPVNRIGQEGLPDLFIKDIPPKISVPVTIDRPEIYYGTETNSYVISNTNIPEFDYPKGNQNVTTHYAGTGGIDVKNGWRKFLMALYFRSTNILFTNYLTPESKVMMHRNINQRVRILARFLRFDSDPYIVLSEGKLYWIADAYTTTDKFPYSNRSEDGYNYIRNSVKITVDAYTGDVTFYVVDDTDPVIKTYQKIFPGMFKNISAMPEDLSNHIRYPRDLFQAQAKMYAIYHMTDPVVFYNKEDEWAVPTEIYDQEPTAMNPYYALINFADQNYQDEYVLMLPFTPSNKNNMVSWFAALCDPDNYGTLIEYQFPKEKLVFGPMQIESRIDQNTEISQLFTLWGQKGSKVIRGNLLVYPVKSSILYVEPIYLQAEQSELPQLKRVIVVYENEIGVGTNLRDALNAIFGEAKIELPEVPAGQILNVQELIDKAVEDFTKAQERLKAGDFAGYGQFIQQLEETLIDLQEGMN